MQLSQRTKLFVVGMWWRILYGVLRIVIGLSVLKVVGQPYLSVLNEVMKQELIEDPSDVLYTFLSHVATMYPGHITYFVALYFIFWGVADVLLSVFLLQKKIWAFPISLAVLAGFVGYEIFRFSYTHSLTLLVVIIIDVSITWLVWREYVRVRT